MKDINRKLTLIQIDETSKMAMSLNGLLVDFAERYRFGLTSDDSIRNFNHFLVLNRRSLIYLFPDLALAELRDTHLMRLIKWWERQPLEGQLTCPCQMNQSTIKRKALMYLRQILNYAYEQERIPKPLLVGFKYKTRVKVQHIRPLPSSAVKQLFAVTYESGYLGKLMGAMLSLMIECGLRRLDLCNLGRGDIDLVAKSINVKAKGGKTGTLGFGERALKLLNDYLTMRDKLFPQNEWLFVTSRGTRMQRRNVNRMLARFARIAGIDKAAPHRCRSTSAVGRLRAGASPFEVQQMLLHSSLDMTLLYTQFAEEEEIAIRGVETSVLDMLLRDEDSGQKGKCDDEKGDGNSPTANGS